jgi:hypothetical protein
VPVVLHQWPGQRWLDLEPVAQTLSEILRANERQRRIATAAIF